MCECTAPGIQWEEIEKKMTSLKKIYHYFFVIIIILWPSTFQDVLLSTSH